MNLILTPKTEQDHLLSLEVDDDEVGICHRRILPKDAAECWKHVYQFT